MPRQPSGKAFARAGQRSKSYRSRPPRRAFRSAFLRRIGSASLATAMSRVHTFKRVGEPVVIESLMGTNRAQAVGNTDLLSVTAGQDAFLANSSFVRGAFKFALSQAANISEITNLFDNYRIVKVKLMFALSATESSSAGSAGYPMPIMHYCYDPDDNTVPATRTAVLENGYCQTRRLDRPFSVTLTPRAQQSVVGGIGGAGGLLPVNTWLDSGSPQIYHYGLKFQIDQFPHDATKDHAYGLTVTPVFYIEAKNVV